MLEPIKISDLSPQDRQAVMTRSTEDVFDVFDRVREILTDVRDRGDAALLNQMLDFEADYEPADLIVSPEEIKAAYDQVAPRGDRLAQTGPGQHRPVSIGPSWSGRCGTMENSPGIILGRMTNPPETGSAATPPGGLAAYPSSVLMTVIPAKTAGVDYVCVATPPKKGMTIPPAILVAADLAGGGPSPQNWAAPGPWPGWLTEQRTVSQGWDKIVGPGQQVRKPRPSWPSSARSTSTPRPARRRA